MDPIVNANWPSISDGPYPLGKYSTLRDEYLHGMAIDGWANASFGDVEAPTGYVWLISNSPEEMREITDAFGPAPEGTVGHFVLIGNSQGFVYVEEFSTKTQAEALFLSLETEFDRWDAQDDGPDDPDHKEITGSAIGDSIDGWAV